ncbi:SLAP domain-containing protein [Fictibacillus phosphorivorans]|uniref:SLAP domain-containing protein n=1 Tax=Fictibacillus phosphorivorans TaxID=1221500 RepID=UPI001292E3B2|nr:SLAP domain-containing protein [Fictibacillus phosphorivorans]
MQKLEFESAWDKTIARQDREEIERVFSELHSEEHEKQQTVILKTAYNHREEFLVTVLVNNYSKEPFSLIGKKVLYTEEEHTMGEMDSRYTLEVPPETSMPWTFIFSTASLRRQPSREYGKLFIM